jgi:hypothetical protein
MQRTVCFHLKDVTPTPNGLRFLPQIDAPNTVMEINLGQLFLQYYFDSYPAAPPNPDPTQFEYLQLISSSSDFRFLAHVAEASLVKRRALSAEMGQAFCRLILHDHFGIVYFAHMNDVLNKPTHAAFNGMRIERKCKGDIPDYLCARSVDSPCIAEAKGRFSGISFQSKEFQAWRDQFGRIRVVDRSKQSRRTKGFIVGTRFVTEANSTSLQTTFYLEDPDTEGETVLEDSGRPIGRTTIAMHYGTVLRKLGLLALASALTNGYPLSEQLSFQVPVWTCFAQPFERTQYIGGFYRTPGGTGPILTDHGWRATLELGTGHSVFIGLQLSAVRQIAKAARGNWEQLDALEIAAPRGSWGSEFAWLADGTVAAPAEYFLPTTTETL